MEVTKSKPSSCPTWPLSLSLSDLKTRAEIVEGSCIVYEIFHANDHKNSTNKKRNTTASVIGKGFAYNEEFSYNKAHLAHHLLFAKSKQDFALAVLISYTIKDDNTNQITTGAMIFSLDFFITCPGL